MNLRTHRKVKRTILTTQGLVEFWRYILRPATPEDARRLEENFGKKSIVPLDCALGIDALPFKITPNLMLDIAYYAADQLSYEKAEEYLFRHLGIKVNDDTIRSVTNYIGRIIFEEDCRIAEESLKQSADFNQVKKRIKNLAVCDNGLKFTLS